MMKQIFTFTRDITIPVFQIRKHIIIFLISLIGITETKAGMLRHQNGVDVDVLELNSFNVVPSGQSVVLSWETGNYSTNYFEVEKSLDGINFKLAGITLDAIENTKLYKFKDTKAGLADNKSIWYRLKHFGVNGLVIYSDSKRIDSKQLEITETGFFPNPFASHLMLTFNSNTGGNAAINLVNVLGKNMVSTYPVIIKGLNCVELKNLPGLAGGIYFAEIFVNGKLVQKQQLVKNP